MGAAGVRRTRVAGSGIILMAARRYLANSYVLTAPSPHRLPPWVGDTYADLVLHSLQSSF